MSNLCRVALIASMFFAVPPAHANPILADVWGHLSAGAQHSGECQITLEFKTILKLDRYYLSRGKTAIEVRPINHGEPGGMTVKDGSLVLTFDKSGLEREWTEDRGSGMQYQYSMYRLTDTPPGNGLWYYQVFGRKSEMNDQMTEKSNDQAEPNPKEDTASDSDLNQGNLVAVSEAFPMMIGDCSGPKANFEESALQIRQIAEKQIFDRDDSTILTLQGKDSNTDELYVLVSAASPKSDPKYNNGLPIIITRLPKEGGAFSSGSRSLPRRCTWSPHMKCTEAEIIATFKADELKPLSAFPALVDYLHEHYGTFAHASFPLEVANAYKMVIQTKGKSRDYFLGQAKLGPHNKVIEYSEWAYSFH